MISWPEFVDWLAAHDLPETACLQIELVPCRDGIHIRAKAIVLDEQRPIIRELADPDDPQHGEYLTEILVRPLVTLPDAPAADHSTCTTLTQ